MKAKELQNQLQDIFFEEPETKEYVIAVYGDKSLFRFIDVIIHHEDKRIEIVVEEV